VIDRPARLPAAFLALAITTVLTGCTGTDPAAVPGNASHTAEMATAPGGQRIEVSLTGGQVSRDTGRVPVAAGEQVTLAITSDVADVVHVHGYDLTAKLTPGTPAELSFPASIPGVFEVELHDAGTVLLSLQVG
jgi:non-ribosomal peptide synthetase component F